MSHKRYAALLVVCLITLVFGAHTALASNRCDIAYINNLDEPILVIKTLYDTPYDEPRPSSSTVNLPPGNEYRLGIQGVTLPTRIILYLPLASYEFTDLSGLAPENAMRLEVSCENGVPILKRVDNDSQQSISGIAHKYLTPENRPFAVDRDDLTDSLTLDDIRALVVDAVRDARAEEEGEPNLENILFTETFESRTTLYFPVFWTSDYAGS
ncbi:hypothetical protein LJB82_02900 [Desulfovibrio sp. OttesenSCG-928-M16]|nr:hypothetical protein [Desulfovibrio sp. OttesenSCG-928-M16]